MDLLTEYKTASAKADAFVLQQFGRINFSNPVIRRKWLEKFDNVFNKTHTVNLKGDS